MFIHIFIYKITVDPILEPGRIYPRSRSLTGIHNEQLLQCRLSTIVYKLDKVLNTAAC